MCHTHIKLVNARAQIRMSLSTVVAPFQNMQVIAAWSCISRATRPSITPAMEEHSVSRYVRLAAVLNGQVTNSPPAMTSHKNDRPNRPVILGRHINFRVLAPGNRAPSAHPSNNQRTERCNVVRSTWPREQQRRGSARPRSGYQRID